MFAAGGFEFDIVADEVTHDQHAAVAGQPDAVADEEFGREVFADGEGFGAARGVTGDAEKLTATFREQQSGAYVHVSSNSGIIGAIGQANYAAANVTLDALATALARRVGERLAPRMRPVLNLTGTVIHTLTIPRGQTAMASGTAAADARRFELHATQGLSTWGICSAPFLEYAFKTTAFTIKVTVNDDGTWGYEEDTVLMIRGQAEPFHHTDRNLLKKIAEPTPNPLAR